MITIKMSKIANTFLYNYKYNWHVKSDNLIKGNFDLKVSYICMCENKYLKLDII